MRKVDVCVIGAGAAGLVSTSGAAQLGLETVLIEAGEMGGDCLNTGCVPSKAILAAAHAAHEAKGSQPHGVTGVRVPAVDFGAVLHHIRGAIKAIHPKDSQERFEGLGAHVIRHKARFTSPRTVEVNGETIHFKRAVIATGSQPFVPPIDGLADTPFLTNETLWALEELPTHLVIIGGGAIGCEMAQAFRRLGAQVTVFEQGNLLGRVDPAATEVLRQRLIQEGVVLHETTTVTKVTHPQEGAFSLVYEKDGTQGEGTASHLLVAAGRVVTTDALNLPAAGVEVDAKGIRVDQSLKTTNKRIFAVGDCNGQYQLTHAAGHEGGQFIKAGVLKLPGAISRAGMPHVTYTDPEIAQVGMTEAQAREVHGDSILVFSEDFAENDRAVAEGKTEGFAKVILKSNGQVLGATIAGAHAGELIHLWSLAISKRLKPGGLSGFIAPYPTYGEINKALINKYFQDKLFSPTVRFVVKLLNLW
ncbi:MAG: FAD-dependent oxidoreductase [Pseudomonadota bacterium]